MDGHPPVTPLTPQQAQRLGVLFADERARRAVPLVGLGAGMSRETARLFEAGQLAGIRAAQACFFEGFFGLPLGLLLAIADHPQARLRPQAGRALHPAHRLPLGPSSVRRLGEMVRDLREKHAGPLARMARKLGINSASISDYMACRRKTLTGAMATQLAQAMGLPIEKFLKKIKLDPSEVMVLA